MQLKEETKMSNRCKEYFEGLLNVRDDKEMYVSYLRLKAFLDLKGMNVILLVWKKLGVSLER